jgi:hypothetical protein|tara:strand:- start:1541 stop:1762 length:222 start_codon:yes stop_codon:yes gene_type:complete
MQKKLEDRHLRFLKRIQSKIESIKKSNAFTMDLEAVAILEEVVFEMQLLIQDNRKLRRKILLAKSLKTTKGRE